MDYCLSILWNRIERSPEASGKAERYVRRTGVCVDRDPISRTDRPAVQVPAQGDPAGKQARASRRAPRIPNGQSAIVRTSVSAGPLETRDPRMQRWHLKAKKPMIRHRAKNPPKTSTRAIPRDRRPLSGHLHRKVPRSHALRGNAAWEPVRRSAWAVDTTTPLGPTAPLRSILVD